MTTWRCRILDPDGRTDDVLLEAEETTTVTELSGGLTRQGYQSETLTIDGRRVSAEQSLAEIGLTHGCTIELGGADGSRWPGMGTYAVVVAGPDTGRWTQVPPGGRVIVGRARSCDLVLGDSLLSGQHLQISQTAAGELLVQDLDSTNGTSLEGARLTEPTPISKGDYLQVGTSIVTVLEVTHSDLASLSATDGASIAFQRRFREPSPLPPMEVRAPRAPQEQSRGFGMSWMRMMAPLVAGLGFFLVMGRNPLYLIIMAASPIIFLIEHLRRKRKDRKDKEADDEEFVAELAQFDARVAELKTRQRIRARAQASPGGIGALFGLVRHRRLWERSPNDDDFCSLTIGLAPTTSDIKIQGDIPEDHPVDLSIWGCPLTHSLLAEGPLAVTGPKGRAQAAARSMLLELATAHSPAEMWVWILTDDTAAGEWNCTRWMPHTFIDEHSGRIASTAQDRAAVVSDLQRLVKNRTGETRDRNQLPLPVHVVLVDGVALVSGSDLSEILVQGAPVGVTAITVDEHLVPEGTGGHLEIGKFADVAAFSSRTQPQTRDVISFEVTARQADLVNRRLGALRPVTGLAANTGGTVRLCDLNDTNHLGPDDMVARWRRGPAARTVVGVDGEVPISIDVMKDGPHGLVGGTTRSGKTEFLKTFLMGLCVENHPDDLSIAIIDFKGGVDHETVAELPHVVDLTTNANIDIFERTTALLNAELLRRQNLFREVGAANLDAYRAARERDPSLLAIPRLLVVVDEFGELLASETGRESLGQLESITRIGGGLGVHLLLVTQNFENQLPAQIAANAGLRVCFRVQEASHSKIVLGSDAAATIPAGRIGRAFLRIHGGELQEFQSARVAGPRPGAVSSEIHTRVVQVPFGTIPSATPASQIVDVPAEQTDLWELIQTSRQAARRTGWDGAVVPWPPPLPEHIPLAEILEEDRAATGAAHARWVLGRADLPDQQRHEVLALEGVDGLMLALGGPNAGLADVVLSLCLTGALTRPADELHFYVVDQLGQGLAALGELPHCGGVATRNDSLGRRLVHHVAGELARRKAAMLDCGATNLSELRQLTGDTHPEVVLVVHGADRVLMQGEGNVSPLYGPLVGLGGEVAGTGFGILLSGLPSVAHNRLGSSATRRLIFAMPSRDDFGALDMDRGVGRSLDRPGLGWDSVSKRVFQAPTVRSGEVPVGELCAAVGRSLEEHRPTPTGGPRVIRDISWPLSWLHIPEPDPPPEVPFAVSGVVSLETGELVWLDGMEDGPVVAVTGPPKSGRSTALLAFGRLARELGYQVVGVPLSRRSPLSSPPAECVERLITMEEVPEVLVEAPGAVVLVDDAHRFDGDTDALDKALRDVKDAAFVVSASHDFFSMRSDLLRALGSIRSALVLAPESYRDADTFGVRRLPDQVLQEARPGRGAMVIAGELQAVQVPDPS